MWNLELECKPDFEDSMKRIYAWYEGEMVDRPPVRFTAHNEDYNTIESLQKNWTNLQERWFDVEYQVDMFMDKIKRKKFNGETFPVFFPNLGPNVYASYYGARLEFGEVTSWTEPIVDDLNNTSHLKLDMNNQYFKKIDELMNCALEKCPGKFIVGYTDLHPGVDCAAAWRGIADFCMDLIDNPQGAKNLIEKAYGDFYTIYNYYDSMLKAKHQLSVSWMDIPSFGKMHIPSCDISAMISTELFTEFCLPILQKEVRGMTHNIFHLDGKGVARHIDIILSVPEINAIQWVQGMGKDQPIMQWIPLLKKIRKAEKSIVVDLQKSELEDFISAMEPEGVLLCIPCDDEYEQLEIIKRLERW